MRLEDLMERAAQYDENLARDIKDCSKRSENAHGVVQSL